MFSEKFIKIFLELLVPELLKITNKFSYGDDYLYMRGLTISKNKIIVDMYVDATIMFLIVIALTNISDKIEDIFDLKEINYENDTLEVLNDLIKKKRIICNDLQAIKDVFININKISKFKISCTEMSWN